ncbi:MAG: DUF4440 domain-containing protein, partial [Casimicrobiaceae bacterium]
SLSDHIRELEERLLQPDVRCSRPDLDRMLASEFVEFASDGRAYDRERVIEVLQHETPFRRWLTDFQITAIAENVLLATYRASRQSGESGELVQSLRSSIWKLRDDRWQLVFHQGTVLAAP